MPKDSNIKSVLIIGSGPIVIGQACEFDYSGNQAIKALREQDIRVILLNSNPATIMTDPNLSDVTYIEPINCQSLEKIIIKEHPDAILATVGGQTALNCALEAYELGILAKYNVKLLGVSAEGIKKAEDRALFSNLLDKLNLRYPKSVVVSSYEEACDFVLEHGFPCVLRPSYTMGGQGGGIAYDHEQLHSIVTNSIKCSSVSQVQVDVSLLGWKEYELEVVVDKVGNCIVVCSIENVDPMGTHTGDSITVAPALTLTDKEYQKMRDASFAILREVGLKTGGANVQFAINPDNGDISVIEVNPRVSRSSALASKATGFPIAKIAALLAIGYTLDELTNDCTKSTPNAFEPSIDYIVCKIPRFDFHKFPQSSGNLHTSMQSVGEAMAIGRNFLESIQKAFCSLEKGYSGVDEINGLSNEEILQKLSERHYLSFLLSAQAIRQKITIDEINKITGINKWFLSQLEYLIYLEEKLKESGKKILSDSGELLYYKQNGFSDLRIAKLLSLDTENVTMAREKLNIHPTFKQIDTCAGEFIAFNNYFYSCYENGYYQNDQSYTVDYDSKPSNRKKVIVLGAGPNRIGQGLEFDYVCVQSVWALQSMAIEAIMINCNPETVSTDYDVADRLYFEPLNYESVFEVIRLEQSKGQLLGIIVQFGGQTPLNIAKQLKDSGVNILGTDVDSIFKCEDRQYFSDFISKLGIKQPKNDSGCTRYEIIEKADKLGYPLIIRPSFVIGGQGMEVVYNGKQLEKYLEGIDFSSLLGNILLDKYLNDAIEVDIDAIGDGENIYVVGAMEQLEEAGIHSGDSSCSLPPFSLDKYVIDKLEEYTKSIGQGLKIKGLMNIQFAIKNNQIFVLEVNSRASRTIPFVAKACGYSPALIATQIFLGKKLEQFYLPQQPPSYYAVKDVVLPFERFPDSDVLLGPQMKSTGEVMGIDKNFAKALIKAYLGSRQKIATEGTILVNVDSIGNNLASILNGLIILNFKLACFKEELSYFEEAGIAIDAILNKSDIQEDYSKFLLSNNIVAVVSVFGSSTLSNMKPEELDMVFAIRRYAIFNNIPYFASIPAMKALLSAIYSNMKEDLDVKSLQEYYEIAYI